MSSPIAALAEQVEGLQALDAPGKRIGKLVRGTVGPGPVKDALSGTWLGHALHPVLTDVVIGSWTSANVLDLVGGEDGVPAANKLVGLGIAAYGITALTGVTDWADAEPADDGVRRTGLVHAATNGTALALYTASFFARRRGARAKGTLLGLAGAGALVAGAYLGGHLIARQGIGVDQTAFDREPEGDGWLDAGPAAALDGGPTAVTVGDTPVLLVRHDGAIAALHDRCSHRGCSLASGEIEDGAVVCACHGSRFRLRDGAIERGPATAPQPAYDAREHGGRIEVRPRA